MELQVILNRLNYNCGFPDGNFGRKTDIAVRNFQMDHKLLADGSVGLKTYTALSKAIDLISGSQSLSTPKTSKYTVKRYGVLNCIEVNPNNIQLVVANKKYQNVTSETVINGTFFWQGQPNGILVYNGKELCSNASHVWQGFGQSVMYYDGHKINVKRVHYASELGDLTKIKWAIGGCGLITPYGYNPSLEGFKGVYADILRRCNKTVLAAKDGKVYFITAKSIKHDVLVQELRRLGFELAISLDGSGSSFMKCEGKIIMPTDGRTVNNWVIAN